MELQLNSIYNDDQNKSYGLLYQLLVERENYESISHSGMPTIKEHTDFIDRLPYKGWYIVYGSLDGKTLTPVGSVYLSYKNEIGISVLKKYRRKGFGENAIKELIKMYPEVNYYANINPANSKSIELFKKLGFITVQYTMKLEKQDADA